MTWTQRGATTSGETASTPCTIAAPAGLQAGDLLVAFIANDSGAASTQTAPSGWAQFKLSNDGSGDSVQLGAYWKLAGASEPTSYSWTLSAGGEDTVGCIVAWVGAASPTPTDVANATVVSGIAGTSTSAPSVTTTAAGDLLLVAYCIDNGSTNISTDTLTLPAALTSLLAVTYSTSGFIGLAVGYEVLGAAGASGALSATNTSAQDRIGMQTSYLAAGSSDPFPAGYRRVPPYTYLAMDD